MLETLLFLIHGTLILFYGIFLSAALSGIRLTRHNNLILLGISAFCGSLQLGLLVCLNETAIWKLYPLIVHFPLALALIFHFKKRIVTVIASILTVYLCCQSAKWFGVLAYYITQNVNVETIIRILILVAGAFVILKFLAPSLSGIFNSDTRIVCAFGIIPLVYYIFDYFAIIYTDLWMNNNRVVAEFLPFFLGISFLLFGILYFKEYEQRSNAERKEKLVRITTEQQVREIEAVRHAETEIRLLRHDMRLLLNNLAMYIDNREYAKAKELISTYSSYIEETQIKRYCYNDTINYILSDFASRFSAEKISFIHIVDVAEITVDEVLFSSILSNALDNALNAQRELPEDKREVRFMLKASNGKLLLSVKNPTCKKPVFTDGLPVSDKKGHGYGSQSIRYMSERLGGNCQFSFENGIFSLRVII